MHQPMLWLSPLAYKSIAYPACAGKPRGRAGSLGRGHRGPGRDSGLNGVGRWGWWSPVAVVVVGRATRPLGSAASRARAVQRPQRGGVVVIADGGGRSQASRQAAFGPQEPQAKARESVSRLGGVAATGRPVAGSAKPGAHTAGEHGTSASPVRLLVGRNIVALLRGFCFRWRCG